MRAKALASEVGQRMAARDKLLADTGFVQAKTKTEQDAEDAILKAGPAIGDASAAAVPMPVPVEASRPGLDAGGYGPQPGIVSPHDQAVHDTLVAREKALGPLLARGTPEQVAQGVGKDYGGAILAAAAGNPAIVSGDSLRIAGGLYSGSAPTTSTVWSAGDTSGVDAEAREKILEARGTPQKPEFKDVGGGLVLPTLQPDGTYKAVPVQGAEPRPPKPDIHDYRGQPGIVALDGNGNPIFTPAQGTAPTPEKPNIITVKDKPYVITTTPDGRTIGTAVDGVSTPIEIKESNGGYVAIDTATNTATPITGAAPQPPIVNVSKDSTPTTRQPDGSLKAVPTDIPPPPPAPPFQSKTDKADALNRIEMIRQKLARGQPLSQDEAGLYETDYKLNYGTTNEKIIDPATGKTLQNKIQPDIPASTPTINDVRKAAGLPLLPPPPPEPKQNARGPTQDEGQMQRYTPQLVASTDRLDKITPVQVPSVFMQQILGVRGNDPSFIQQVLASTSFVNPQQRDFAQSVAEYNQSLLYMLSGKAITSDEYKRAMTGYIPQPGDDARQLAWKADQRHSIIATAVRLGWANDPDTAKVVKDNIKANGIDLDKYDLTIPRQPVDPPPTVSDPKLQDRLNSKWPTMTDDEKAQARKMLGAQ